MSKGIPEEVKNQIIDGKERVITVPLPEKAKKAILEKRSKKNKLAQQIFQISLKVTREQMVLQELSKQLDKADDSIKYWMEKAFKKLKLDKKKDRNWRFDNIDSFVGILNTSPKKKEK